MADYTPENPIDAFIRGMVRRGWTPAEAAGAAGNIKVESGFSPSIKSSVPGEESYGFLQWNHERLSGLKNYAEAIGKDWRDPEVQMDWIDMERKGHSTNFGGSDERTAYKKAFAGGGTPAEIAARFGQYVERPQDLSKSVEQRKSAAGGPFTQGVSMRVGPGEKKLMGPGTYPNMPPMPEETPYQALVNKYGGRDKIPPGDYLLDNELNPDPEGTETEKPSDLADDLRNQMERGKLAPKPGKIQKAAAAEDQRDIIWKKIDPKTYYLYNRYIKQPDQQQSDPYSGTRSSPSEKELAVDQQVFRHDMLMYGRDAAVARAEHHMRIRALTEFDHDLQNDPNVDIKSRVQDLLDRGILRLDDKGDLWHDGVELPPEMDQRILHATQLWNPQEEPDTTTPEIGGGINQEIDQAKQMTPTTLDPNAQQGEQ